MFEVIEMCGIAPPVDPCEYFFVVESQSAWECC